MFISRKNNHGYKTLRLNDVIGQADQKRILKYNRYYLSFFIKKLQDVIFSKGQAEMR